MSGFFGVIQTDRPAWVAMRLRPRPVEAALLIRRCRGMAADDGLAEISEMVFLPLNPESQMIAATAVALLLNTPFFFIEGESDGRDCQVKTLQATTATEALQRFDAYISERFSVNG
jgi:hypothetical protein